MNDFTASNGVTVRLPNGTTSLVDLVEAGGSRLSDWDYLDSAVMQALREFFQAEADERLGRWRWPEDPSYVVYHDKVEAGRPTDGTVVVSHEPSGDRGWCDPGGLARAINGGTARKISAAAIAYFAAHPKPEPKPWHRAKPGELWLVNGEPRAVHSKRNAPYTFSDPFNSSLGVAVDDPTIADARRIFPEGDVA